MTQISPPPVRRPVPTLAPAVRRRLGQLRAAIRRRLLIEGLARVLIALVAAALATLVVDYGLYWITRQHMTVAQRLVVLAGCLSGVGYVAWRFLIRPQQVRITDDDLALIVERAHPELADRLISALQFSRMDDPETRGTSVALVVKMAEQANAMAESLRFPEALRNDRALRQALAAVGAVLVLLTLFAAKREVMSVWWSRLALLRNAEYPRETQLRLEGPTVLRIGRGSPLEVAVTANPAKYVPGQVTFHMKFASAGAVDEVVSPMAADLRRFVKKFEVVNEPFTFYVTGNDDRTAVVNVEVAEPPALRDVSFTILAPDYTHLRSQVIGGGQGVVNVPLESTVVVSATATKDLSSATLLLDGAPAGACTILPVNDVGARHPRGVQCQFRAAAPKPFKPAMNLRFALTDAEGFSSRQGAQYTLMLQQDKAPTVQINAVGVSGQISTRAMIPVQFSAKDDYGVRQIDLEWAILSAGEKRTRVPVRRMDPDEVEPRPFSYTLDLLQLAGPPVGATTRPANSQPASRPAETSGAAFGLGESIRLTGLAMDALPGPDGPNTGLSNPITLKIVSDEELLAALVDSQRSLREQFRQVVTSQAEAKGKTDAASERAREKDGLADAQRLAGESSDQQQQINDRTAAMVARFEEILLQMNNNRIGSDADKHRLRNKIIAPLQDLATSTMKTLAGDLANAKAQADAAALAGELARLAAAQDKVKTQMDAILAEMIKVENAQQVEHGLKVIIDMTEKVQTLTASQRKQESPATRPETQTPARKQP